MPSIFITGSNPYGYSIGSTQVVSDSVALLGLATADVGGGWARLSSLVTPAGITPQDREKSASMGGGGGGAVTSVAGKTGAVTLASTDLTDGSALNAAVSSAASAASAAQTTANGKRAYGSVTTESADRALVAGDDGGVGLCAAARSFTVNTTTLAGGNFQWAAKGAGVVTFVAGSGVTVTDERVSGAANPVCAVVQTGAAAVSIIGNKA